jgi:general secretion pathway protein J
MSNLKNLRGFSLIEVMVAVVLMGMMGSLLMTSINSSLKAKDTVEEISGRYQVVRQAMSRMAREISMAYLSKHINVTEPAYVTQFKGKSESLYFSAFGNVVRQKDAKQSDQQVLGYYLAQDKSGQQSLMRRNHPNLNLDVLKEGRAQVLCPKVSKLVFSYYDDRFDRWEESWSADPLQMAAQGRLEGQDKAEEKGSGSGSLPKPWRLPRFVKISMTVEMAEGVEMTWISEAEIPIQEPLDLN